MADTSISNLTATSPATAAHRIPIAITPFGAGNNGYITPALILSYGTSPVTGTTITASTQFKAPFSLSTVPYACSTDGTTGIAPTNGAMNTVVSGVAVESVIPTEHRLAPTYLLGWTSTGVNTSGNDLQLSRYAAKQLMISGDGTGATTNAGWILGYFGTTGQSGIWQSTVTPSTINYTIFADGTNTLIGGRVYANAAMPFGTKTTSTNGAGAQAGTLTNAPAVGNPTKWIPFDDNGTTRYIPAW